MKDAYFFNTGKFKALLFFLICGGLLSTYLGKNVDFDTLNYHYYNPWAFIHNRLLVDGFPTSIQAFFNPVGDLPFFFVAHFLPDHIAVFLIGMPAGLAMYVLWNLFGVLDAERSVWHWVIRALSCALAVTGAACFSQANSPTGELMVSVLVALAIALLIDGAIHTEHVGRSLTKAGLSLGIAAGLKLTAAVPVLAVILAMPVLLYRRVGSRRAFIPFFLAMGCGFLFCAGPWMLRLYLNFHNPLFPFFNNVFHSSLLDGDSMLDTRFITRSFGKLISFPLFAALVKNQFHSELTMRDPRLLLGQLISLWWIARLSRARFRSEPIGLDGRIKLFLAVTFLVGYFAEMRMFGIYRYMIVFEFLSVIMAFVMLSQLVKRHEGLKALGLGLIICVGCFALTVSPNWGVLDTNGGKYFNDNLPRLPSESMVLSLVDGPMGYLVPQWPGHPPVISPISGLTRPGHNAPLQSLLARRIESHKGPIFVLLESAKSPDLAAFMLQVYELELMESDCQIISDTIGKSFKVCPTKRQTPTGLNGFDGSRTDNEPFPGSYFPVENASGVWVGPKVFINFLSSDVSRKSRLLISGWVPFEMLQKTSPGMHDVSLDVYVNGSKLATKAVGDQNQFDVDVPASALLAHADGLPVISVEIRISASAVPAEIGTGPDVRRLSAFIRKIIVI
jgi:hypothetical protein